MGAMLTRARPAEATVGSTEHLDGKYYVSRELALSDYCSDAVSTQTVNSLIVRDTRFNPLGENKRDGSHLLPTSLIEEARLTDLSAVTLLRCARPKGDVAFVQIGALLVSSIRQSQEPGTVVARGDELGYFAYGGSTIVAVFERDSVEWDEDLLRNSAGDNDLKLPLETMVKVRHFSIHSTRGV